MFFPYPPSWYSQNFVSRYTLQRLGTFALGFSVCDNGLFRNASRVALDILGRWVWESAHVHVSSLRGTDGSEYVLDLGPLILTSPDSLVPLAMLPFLLVLVELNFNWCASA